MSRKQVSRKRTFLDDEAQLSGDDDDDDSGARPATMTVTLTD